MSNRSRQEARRPWAWLIFDVRQRKMKSPGDAQDAVRFVEKDAFVMPVIPESLGVDPVFLSLLHGASFLELSGDKSVDPDWAVEALEHLAHYLQRLDPQAVAKMEGDLIRLSAFAKEQKHGERFIRFLSQFTYAVGLRDKE